MSRIYCFGNNRSGQLGCAYTEDITCTPILMENLQSLTIHRITSSLNQTEMITADGTLLNCGENENNELGRTGKKSMLGRVDALEAFSVIDVAAGNGFFLVACNDGRLMTWGRNDLGQLGNGNREPKEKPRFNHPFRHQIIQIAAGGEHVVALSSAGLVLTWGGNRKGQLGDGQFTSRSEPQSVPELKHRPVISVSCGESHSLALTAGGDVYSWGENVQGELGLDDTKNRLRPEIIRSLKTVNCVKISAGGHHSMVISHPEGLIFAFGSNSHGQLGLGLGQETDSSSNINPEDRLCCRPTVIDRLRDYQVLDVACGLNHTLLVCRSRLQDRKQEDEKEIGHENGHVMSDVKVFSMGLNSSGQCGIEHYHNTAKPTQIIFRDLGSSTQGYDFVSVHASPLAYHSFVSFSSHPMNRKNLPSVDLIKLEKLVNQYNLNQQPKTLNSLRELIAESYSSISVLNSSFRVVHSQAIQNSSRLLSSSSSSPFSSGNPIDLDLDSVRKSYQLIFSTNSEQVLSTLGRTLLLVSDHLKECPFDSPENLNVFIIVLENPLLLHPNKLHIVLQRLVTGILAIPKSFRVMFFSWLKHFSSEYFSRIILVMQTFLSFILKDKSSNLDPTPVVLVIDSLFSCNQEANIVPLSLFCNQVVPQTINIYEEWNKFKSSDVSKIFNFFSYPFLFPIESKNHIIRSEFRNQMSYQSNRHVNKYLLRTPGSPERRLPRGAVVKIDPMDPLRISIVMELRVNRENLLSSLEVALRGIIEDDITTLLLPLTVVFENEDAVDAGGVTKELFTLAIKEYLESSDLLHPCGDFQHLWFTRTNINQTNENIDIFFDEYLLGILLGLACYNGVLVNLPIVPIVYKFFNGGRAAIEDLWAADSSLARSLQSILDYSEVGTSFSEIFGISFVATSNPLIDSSSTLRTTPPTYVELIPNGTEIQVTRANRQEFVNLFIEHSLYKCCQDAIENFLSGLRVILHNQALSLCTSLEIEDVICGSSDLIDLDLNELRKQTTYLGEYHDQHPVIVMFWETINSLTMSEMRNFLLFLTATDRVPIGGFNQLRLKIQPTSAPSNALPVAHTCFNLLDLPSSYQSTQQLKDRLMIALQHSQGFGLA